MSTCKILHGNAPGAAPESRDKYPGFKISSPFLCNLHLKMVKNDVNKVKVSRTQTQNPRTVFSKTMSSKGDTLV